MCAKAAWLAGLTVTRHVSQEREALVAIEKHHGTHKGKLTADKAGTYWLVWDNTYSILKSKSVEYQVYPLPLPTATTTHHHRHQIFPPYGPVLSRRVRLACPLLTTVPMVQAFINADTDDDGDTVE
jgi:hypothetical protein